MAKCSILQVLQDIPFARVLTEKSTTQIRLITTYLVAATTEFVITKPHESTL
jgi:hypothetical protein